MLRPRKTLVLAICLAAGTLYYQFFLFLPRTEAARMAKGLTGYHYGGDFYPVWLAGRSLARNHADPYSEETTRRIQGSLYGHSLDQPNLAGLPQHYQAFVYPLHTEILASPVLVLPFPAARIVITVLFCLFSGISLVWWLRGMGLPASHEGIAIFIILTLASLPLLEALFAVQWGLLAAALLAASVAAAHKQKFASAGFLLALSTTKPQIVALAVLYLLFWSLAGWRQRRALAITFFVTMVALLGASELILPGWLPSWWHAVMRYGEYTQAPLVRDLLGKVLGTTLTVALLAAAVALAWRARRTEVGSPTFSSGLAFVLTTTTLTVLHSDAIYDHEILLPAILLVIISWRTMLRRGPAVRLILVMTGLALSWQWIAASAVSVAAFILGRTTVEQSNFALQLPLRASASFPFALIAILGLMAVQLFRKPGEEQKNAS